MISVFFFAAMAAITSFQEPEGITSFQEPEGQEPEGQEPEGQEPEGQEPEGQEPEDFERLLPRGQIAAISEPTYVPASEANLPPRAWVLGVVIDGQARAYSLDLLNSHEIVNDRIGETNFAAVW